MNLHPRTSLAELSETDLLVRVRAGDTDAYAELYDRHRGAALRVATAVAGASRAEDLVAESFTRILRLLLDGRGPDSAFRAYLFTAIRNTHVNVYRKDRNQVLVDDFGALEHDHVEADPWPELVENLLVADALQTLPQRWQDVIRLTTVEEKPLDEVAEILRLSPGAVAQLAHRAREALRLAYLAQHAKEPVADDCRTMIPLLARHARGSSNTGRTRVESHLSTCSPCRSARSEIVAVAGTLHQAGRA